MVQDDEMRLEKEDTICDLRSQDLAEMSPNHLKMLRYPCCEREVTSPMITQLLLDHNDIERIPEEIGDVTSLKKLSVVGNQLYSLPESIGRLVNLQVLNVSENEIISFPSTIKDLKNLVKLSAVANSIKSVETGTFSGLKKLRELLLDENCLASLPEDFGDLENLERFECSENEIAILPNGFGNLANLKILSLDSNRLAELSHDFHLLSNLEILLLSNNNLHILPTSMASSTRLEKLILSKNELTSIPQWFDDLENIKELALEDNELLDQPFDEIFCKSATKITSLSAGRNYISKLPDNIGLLRNLTHLHLGSTMFELERSNFQSGNWLSSLPESFAELVNLEKLHLDENQIRALPEDIGKLIKLQWLDLGQNQLEYLPKSFCELRALKYLQISKNRLKALPSDIGNLERLIELRLDSNMIGEIPESISKLRIIHSLDLFNNCLKEFPKSILALSSLKRLDVEGNNFSTCNLPKIIRENVYPERDSSLKDNWRGKTREDKVKCEVITIPAVDTHEEAGEEEEEESVNFNENALISAMRAGMSLWRHHEGASERVLYSKSNEKEDCHEIENIPSMIAPITQQIEPQTLKAISDWSSTKLEEDWDEELRDDLYQDTLDMYDARKHINSALINDFQNNINRYPPCIQAYSNSACYDSLVYKKAPSTAKSSEAVGQEEGQFDDADE